jgi:hypothetical protein
VTEAPACGARAGSTKSFPDGTVGTDLRAMYRVLLSQHRRHLTLPAPARGLERLKRPLRPAYNLLRLIRQQGRAVAGEFGVGFARQLVELLRLQRELGVKPETYYRFRLFLDQNWRRRHEFVSLEENILLLHYLNQEFGNGDDADLVDKARFFRRMQKTGLPIIPILAEIRGGHIEEHCAVSQYPSTDLFSKPSDRYCGQGSARWRLQPDGTYHSGSFVANSVPDVHAHLARSVTSGTLLLQPAIANHPSLVGISGRAVSTARIVTIRRRDGELQVVLPVYRMAVGDTPADNLAQGAVAAPIDLETGRLGLGRYLMPAQGPNEVRTHPDTGAPITGLALPFWEEAKALALAAHSEFKHMISVGWDVALTERGPVLVEGNAVWSIEMPQIIYDIPLGSTPTGAVLRSYLAELSLIRAARA